MEKEKHTKKKYTKIKKNTKKYKKTHIKKYKKTHTKKILKYTKHTKKHTKKHPIIRNIRIIRRSKRGTRRSIRSIRNIRSTRRSTRGIQRSKEEAHKEEAYEEEIYEGEAYKGGIEDEDMKVIHVSLLEVITKYLYIYIAFEWCHVLRTVPYITQHNTLHCILHMLQHV